MVQKKENGIYKRMPQVGNSWLIFPRAGTWTVLDCFSTIYDFHCQGYLNESCGLAVPGIVFAFQAVSMNEGRKGTCPLFKGSS